MRAAKPTPSTGAEHGGVRAVSARAGIAMALGASLCWALSTVIMRPAIDLVDPLVANALRLPVGCLVLVGLSLGNRRGGGNPFAISRRSVAVLALAGSFSAISGGLW